MASHSTRLAIVLSQTMIREEASFDETLAPPAMRGDVWRTRLNYLAFKGISQVDLRHWAWCMEPESTDEQIERFLGSARYKPMQILFFFLREDSGFAKRESLERIWNHISQYYCERRNPSPAEGASMRRALVSALNMTPARFVVSLERLAHHCRRLWPESQLAVAHLAVRYLENIESSSGDEEEAFKAQSTVFNSVIQILGNLAYQRPLYNSCYNWMGQKALLAFSANLGKSLPIERDSYKAIRKTLLATKKSEAERQVSSRLSKVWPPVPLARDGVDESQDPEDAYSRVVKAGFMMQEAGYSKDDYDTIMDTLSGVAADSSPTIQSRATLPQFDPHGLSSELRHATWAARIRAARNAQESWAIFQHPPEPGMQPDLQIYREMFAKLVARTVELHDDVFPGDGAENFPVYDTNLTDFEMARIKPPSVEQLFLAMLKDRIRPEGQCLAILIRSAPTLKVATRYLKHSSLPKSCITDLVEGQTRSSLMRVPLAIFEAWISMLCARHPNRTSSTSRDVSTWWLKFIPRAIYMAQTRLAVNASETRFRKAAWLSILKALARPNVIVSRESPARDNHLVMANFMGVWKLVEDRFPEDFQMYEVLCFMLQKFISVRMDGLWRRHGKNWDRKIDLHEAVLGLYLGRKNSRSETARRNASEAGLTRSTAWPHVHSLGQSFHEARERFKKILAGAIATPSKDLGSSKPQRSSNSMPSLGGMPLHLVHNSMRTLAFLGEFDEMVVLLGWVIDERNRERVQLLMEPLGRKHPVAVVRALCAFRAFAESRVDSVQVAELRERLNALNAQTGWDWYWPSDEEVCRYVEAGSEGREVKLRDVLQLLDQLERE
jgi:DNA (cytosine-5)-methyltransferase 1